MNLALIFLFQIAFAQSPLSGVQSGRYEVHPAKSEAVTASREPAQATPRPKSAGKNFAPKTNNLSSSDASSAIVTVPEAIAPARVSEQPTSSSPAEPSLTEQAQSLVEGNPERVYNFYREQVHPEDPRNNRIEVEIKPGFFANDSKSNYSFREYAGTMPTLGFRSNIWLTPMIGLGGQYTFSLSGDINGNQPTSSRLSAHYEFLDVGVKVRHYFGLSRKAKSLEFELLYTDSKLNLPSDNKDRVRLKTNGLGLGLKARIPQSGFYAWTLAAQLYPRLIHAEEQTGLLLHSGDSSENVRMGFDVGGEFKFERAHQMIWSMGIQSERNLFQGTANVVDPRSGQSPSNVSVTNTMYMFNLGYRWGQ